MWGGFCFPVDTYLSQWPRGSQGWGRAEDCYTALAMVMRARLLETASLSGNGFVVLITGSVLETGQSIQTSCCDGCFQHPDHPACVLFSFHFLGFLFLGQLPGFWDLSSLTSDQTGHLAVKARSPNQWSPRAFPVSFLSVVQFVFRLATHLGVASRIALCWEPASYSAVRTWQPSHLSTHINHCACFVPDMVHPHLGSACVQPLFLLEAHWRHLQAAS